MKNCVGGRVGEDLCGRRSGGRLGGRRILVGGLVGDGFWWARDLGGRRTLVGERF